MQTVQQILMKWAFENKEYYMAYILYKEYNTGIPNYLLYNLPSKNFFSSINASSPPCNQLGSSLQLLTPPFNPI